MMNRQSLLALCFVFCITPLALAADFRVIRGMISKDDGVPAVGVQIVLNRIIMAEKPSLTLIQRTRTDPNGNYSFRIPSADEKVFYRVAIDSNGLSTGSEPIRFEKNQSSITVDLSLPRIVFGIEHLSFLKNILVVDLLIDAVRVTEIINFENTTGGLVDARKIPFVKTIPKTAFDFQFFQRRNTFTAVALAGKITFGLLVPQGKQQLYFSYNLPANDSSISFENDLPPGVREVELIVPEDRPDAYFDVSSERLRDRMIEQVKSFEERVYRSTRLPLDGRLEHIGIRIENIPLSQKKLLYPAALLLILLLFGLFWFLRSNRQ